MAITQVNLSVASVVPVINITPPTPPAVSSEILARFPNAAPGFVPNPAYPLLTFTTLPNGSFGYNIVANTTVTTSASPRSLSNYGTAGNKVIFTLPVLSDTTIDIPLQFFKVEDATVTIIAPNPIRTDRIMNANIIVNSTLTSNTTPRITLRGHKDGEGYFWQAGITTGEWVATFVPNMQ